MFAPAGAALVAPSLFAPSLFASMSAFAGTQSRLSLGCEQNRVQFIDADFALTPYLEKIRDAGVRTVGRYYDRDYGSGAGETCWHNPTKKLTKTELNAIEDAGLSVVAVFEHCGANCVNFGADNTVTADKGRKDAAAAIQQADELGQPADTPVYFAIDFDPVPGSGCKLGADGIWQSIETYFNQINDVFAKTRWQVGIYGAGRPCQFVKDRKLAKYFWLSASMAHEGTNTFFNRDTWHIFQNRIDLQKEYGRKGEDMIDTNVINPTALDANSQRPFFGQWNSKGRAALHDINASLDILQSRAFLKASCGYKKDMNEKLRPSGSRVMFNATCRIMSEARDGYVGINLTEGDDIEGYVHESDIIAGLWRNMPRFDTANACAPAPKPETKRS